LSAFFPGAQKEEMKDEVGVGEAGPDFRTTEKGVESKGRVGGDPDGNRRLRNMRVKDGQAKGKEGESKHIGVTIRTETREVDVGCTQA